MLEFVSVIGIAMGLLALTLTPCLMQLVFVYFAAITGVSVADANQLDGQALERSRWKVVLMTGTFVAGFTLVFTITGFAVGWFGETIKSIPLWSGDSAIGEQLFGVGFLVLGVWMANTTRAPILCKLPFPRVMDLNSSETGYLGMFSAGFVYMFGCATCFSGALFAVLLGVVGVAGAPIQGALIMFFFSLGVGIPLLVSAALLTEVYPHLTRIQTASRYMGLVASVFIIGMGIVAISGNFHVLSDLIATYVL